MQSSNDLKLWMKQRARRKSKRQAVRAARKRNRGVYSGQ